MTVDRRRTEGPEPPWPNYVYHPEAALGFVPGTVYIHCQEGAVWVCKDGQACVHDSGVQLVGPPPRPTPASAPLCPTPESASLQTRRSRFKH